MLHERTHGRPLLRGYRNVEWSGADVICLCHVERQAVRLRQRAQRVQQLV